MFDAVILGGGPAGLSCALELHDSNVSYVVLDRAHELGGSLPEIRNTIRNFVGGFYNDGEELKTHMLSLVHRMNLNCITNAKVETVELDKRSVFARGIQYIGRTLVIATGCRRRKLRLPGESMFKDDVFYYTEGNEEQLHGKNIAIIGGGDSALMDSLDMARYCPSVFLIHRSKKFRARPEIIQSVNAHPRIKLMLSTEIDSLNGTDHLRGIQVVSNENGEVIDLAVDKMIVKVGYAPNTELFRGQINMNNAGYIMVNEHLETSTPNVLAVGDCVTPNYPRIAAAAGHGIAAAGRVRLMLANRQ